MFFVPCRNRLTRHLNIFFASTFSLTQICIIHKQYMHMCTPTFINILRFRPQNICEGGHYLRFTPHALPCSHSHTPTASCPTSTSDTRKVAVEASSRRLPSRFVLRRKQGKTRAHTQRVLGFSLLPLRNLSKHAGVQTIQSRAKETRQTGPGVMLSQQRMSDLKGKRGFVGNLHTRGCESYRGRSWAAGSHSLGSKWNIISLLDGLLSLFFSA